MRNRRYLSTTELQTIEYIATLLLVAVAIITKVDNPVVWTLLGMAIGSLLEKYKSASTHV